MDWLFLGGNSALAKNVMQFLPTGSHCVKTSRRLDEIDATTLFLDFADSESIENFIPPNNKGVAFFCVSEPRYDVCEAEPEKTRTINVTNTLKLAHKLAALGWKIVYPSSSSVFDGSNELVTTEDMVNPQTEYGRQKVRVEKDFLESIPNALIMRFGKIIFPDNQFLTDWVLRLCKKESVSAFCDYVFAPVSSDEAAKALIALVLNEEEGIWHVSSAQELSYEKAAKILATTLNITLDKVQGVEGRVLCPEKSFPKHASLDASRTELFLGKDFTAPEILLQNWLKQHIESNKIQ